MPHPLPSHTAAETEPPSKRSIAVILNPAARSAKAERYLDTVRSLAVGAHVAETRAAGDARRLARELAEQGWSTVVGAGGDGTINEVVTGLMEAQGANRPSLGLFPMGTMNVFALELGLPVPDLAECWNRIAEGNTRTIDVWQADTHVFVQMAGVGVDAQVIRETSWEAKKQWGPLSYLGALTRVLECPPGELRISVDDGPWLTGSSVLLGNGRLYGGPFPVFPDAVNEDGLIDIAIVHGHGPATFSNLVADVLLNKIDENHEGVSRRCGRRVRIESAAPVPFEIDGELGGETPLTITRHQHRLRVIV